MLTAIVILRCHLNIGKDVEPNLWWLHDGDAVGGHLGGSLCSEELDAWADLFEEVKCKVDDFDKLVKDVHHR